jgi:hypothetical protein
MQNSLRFILVLAVAAGLIGAPTKTPPAFADKLKVERRILLPDGQPAAGVGVILRSLNKTDGSLKQEVKAATDATGLLSAEIEVEPEERLGDPGRITGYLIVDALGTALTFENFNSWRHWAPDNIRPIHLTAGYTLSGKVVTNAQVPVPNAKIAVQSFSTEWSPWRLNDPNTHVATPELFGTSGADGTFTLRAVAINEATSDSADVRPRLNMSATAVINGQTWIGWTELSPGKADPPPTEKPDPFSIIPLYPTLSVRGKVVSEATGQLVAGAAARLVGHPNSLIVTLPPAVTGPDGAFEFKDVPAVFQLFVEVSHPDMAKGWTRIGEEHLAVFNRNGPKPNSMMT